MPVQNSPDAVFNPGLAVTALHDPLGFSYGDGIFGPNPEFRSLDAIRKSLLDPDCDGPDPVYAIVMDVGKEEHRAVLRKKMLLYGIVTYAAGKLGNEPVRSQGHKHAVSAHSGWSPPELYEIWSGRAIIYIQEKSEDDPGRCFAISAGPGETVLVPPGWVHCTVSADARCPLTFGAWCDREYGFDYDAVRSHHGLAWYPVWNHETIVWHKNPYYRQSGLIEKKPEDYAAFGIQNDIPIYTQFERSMDAIQFISMPILMKERWNNFIP